MKMNRIKVGIRSGLVGVLLAVTQAQAVDNTGSGGKITFTDASGLNPTNTPYLGGYVVHTFTNSGTLNIPTTVTNASVLVVAGGGGGGAFIGGGGGAGGYIYSTAFSLGANTNYTVTVGAGGLGGYGLNPYYGYGENGSNSVFGSLIAYGGGGGGASAFNDGGNGIGGGSGGGGSHDPDFGTGGSATNGQGNAGGVATCWGGGNPSPCGGGGGAGSAGSNGSLSTPGHGGLGKSNAISGVTTWYAGGGGGGNKNANGGNGGQGGGGLGAGNNSALAGNGVVNTGGGGGGMGQNSNVRAGDGGSGIVIVRYPYDSGPVTVTLTGPAHGRQFTPGSSITATATVFSGKAPYTVTFYTSHNGGAYGPDGTASASPYTVSLGTLEDGTYSIYATVTDNVSSNAASATNTFTVAPDTTPPLPDPMTFAVAPRAIDANTIIMTASNATDAISPPVQYYFENTINGTNSGWISSTVWTNTGLTQGTSYGYRVKARDSAVSPNETGYSAVFTAVPVPQKRIRVQIFGLNSQLSGIDGSTLAQELNNILGAAAGFYGSSATCTTVSGQTLTEAYYHPTYRAATRAALTNNCDYLVLLPESRWMVSYPEGVFEGVLRMSRQALDAGIEPVLMMPAEILNKIAIYGTNTYRIANGCGIDAIPTGFAQQAAGLTNVLSNLFWPRLHYLRAATLFTKITGQNAADTGYIPTVDGSTLDVTNLAAIAVNTLTNGALHYASSRHTEGLIRCRHVIPSNNVVRVAMTGTSTENWFASYLSWILGAQGFNGIVQSMGTSQNWGGGTLTDAKPYFDAAPNQYYLAYARATSIDGTTITAYKEPNLIPILYDRHYDGHIVPVETMLDEVYNRSTEVVSEAEYRRWQTIPVHIGAARLYDVDPTVVFSEDGIHPSPALFNMMGAMMVTSVLGIELTPTTTIATNSQSLNGFNVGKRMIKQMAYLSETEAFVPDTALAIQPCQPQVAGAGLMFNYTFVATNGTAPYTWTEESTTGLPPGLTVTPTGQLAGIPTTGPGLWRLVLQVKDSTGAIRKLPVSLSVGSQQASTNNAYLNYLVSSVGTLAPGFASVNFSYTANVPYPTNTLTVTPTAAATNATITVNGTPVVSGSPSGPINLSVGANVITAVVVSPDLTATNTYTLTVTRAAPQTNANLASLVPSAGSLTPAFSSGVFSYTASVPYSVPALTLTPTVEDTTATVTVNGTPVASGSPSGPVNLSVGTNLIDTVVVAEDGIVTNTYALTVIRAPGSTNAFLANLVPSAGALNPGFDSATFNYTDNVTFATATMTVTPTAVDSAALIRVNGSIVTSGTASTAINLNVGSNLITITVTAEDSAFTNIYLVAANRAASITRWWDGGSVDILTNGNAASAGGAGTWNTTLQNWDQGNDQAHVPWVNAGDEIAYFGGTAGTVTNQGVTVGGLIFTAAYTLTSGTITLAGSGSVSNSAAVTIASSLAGAAPLVKSGTGTLTLTGTNTFSGGLVINGGTLAASANTSLGAANIGITLNVSATMPMLTVGARPLALNNSAIATFYTGSFSTTGPVTGDGGIQLAQNNAGGTTVTLLSTGNTFTGPITLGNSQSQAMDLTVNSLADSANPITFDEDSGTPNPSFTWGSGAVAPLVLNSRPLVFQSTLGSFTLQNANTTPANTITINTGLQVPATGAKTVILTGVNTGNNTFAGAITNGSNAVISLTKSGTGTWILSGNNTYSGGTTVSAGILKANGANALGASNVTVTAGTLHIDAANAMADTATLRLPSASAVNLVMNANDTVGKLFLGGVQQPNGTYTSTGLGSGWMTGTGALTVGSAAAQPVYWDLDGATAGAGGATPSGTWDAANAYWNVLSDGTGATNVWTAGATAAFAAGTDATGTYTVTVDGTQDISGLSFEEGDVTLAGGTALRQVSDSVALVATNRTATLLTPLTQDATTRSLTKIGPGTLILSATNSYSGATTLGAGTLQLANTNAIGSSTALNVANGATLALRSDTASTFNSPTNANTVNTVVEGATVTLDVNNNGSGSGNTLTLGGGLRLNSTLSGTTRINVTGGNGYKLRLPTLIFVQNGNPNLYLTATNGLQVDNLRFSFVAGSTGSLYLDGTNANASVNSYSFASEYGGQGNWLYLYKQGSGTWTWGATNTSSTVLGHCRVLAGNLIVTGTLRTYTGSRDVYIQGGTLHYNNAGAVDSGNGGMLYFAGGNIDNSSGTAITTSTYNPLQYWGANFTFLGSNGTNSDLNLGTGAVTMNATRTVTINSNATLTVGGVISGAGFGLTKSGTGTLKLTGQSTYTGATTVSNGTLLVNGSLTNLSAVTVVSGGQLGGTGTIKGTVTVNSGGTLKPGDLTGALIITSNLTVNAGATNLFALGTVSASCSVTGNLTYAGTVVVTDAGGFGPGTNILFTYTGSLTDNGIAVNNPLPGGRLGTIDTSTPGQIKLIVTSGSTPPVAAFTAAPTNGYVPLRTVFTDNSTGTITNRHWSFGDGNTFDTVSQVSVTNLYTNAGVYTVSLTVTGSGGAATNTQPGLIGVQVVPPPEFMATNGPVMSASGGAWTFTVGSVEGLQYRLVYKNDLTSTGTAWQAITPPFPDGWTNGGNGVVTLQDPGSTGVVQRFYRLESKSLYEP